MSRNATIDDLRAAAWHHAGYHVVSTPLGPLPVEVPFTVVNAAGNWPRDLPGTVRLGEFTIYGCPPYRHPDLGPDWIPQIPFVPPPAGPWPPGTFELEPPEPEPPSLPTGVPAGLAKLLPAMREHARKLGRPLDADEACALVWLEGVAVGARR